jgi:hypothetical protein
MKLSNESLVILKNFASISSGLYVPGGSKVRVKNAKSTVLAEAVISETFPEFCVADLNKLLGILTVDKEVDINFKGNDIVLSMLQGRSKINYRCSAKNLVNVPKNTDMTIGPEEGFASFYPHQRRSIVHRQGFVALRSRTRGCRIRWLQALPTRF